MGEFFDFSSPVPRLNSLVQKVGKIFMWLALIVGGLRAISFIRVLDNELGYGISGIVGSLILGIVAAVTVKILVLVILTLCRMSNDLREMKEHEFGDTKL